MRGRLLHGAAAEALIGVGEAESAAIVDGILTLGILWLDHCRQHGDGRRHFGDVYKRQVLTGVKMAPEPLSLMIVQPAKCAAFGARPLLAVRVRCV